MQDLFHQLPWPWRQRMDMRAAEKFQRLKSSASLSNLQNKFINWQCLLKLLFGNVLRCCWLKPNQAFIIFSCFQSAKENNISNCVFLWTAPFFWHIYSRSECRHNDNFAIWAPAKLSFQFRCHPDWGGMLLSSQNFFWRNSALTILPQLNF